jgi:glycosyltransferase involved in cell wall biosynthesis
VTEPLVSVVTPCLNGAPFAAANIRSVADQTYANVEHIVIDGGSTDGTVDILRRHGDIRWESGPDEGQSDALNKGFALASGEILGWLNIDDYYLPHAVAAAVRELQGDTELAAVYANAILVDESGTEIGRSISEPFDFDRALRVGNLVPQPTAFFRRDIFEQVGGVRTAYHYAMDYDLWLRIGKRERIRHVDDYWAAFRLHEASKTGTALKRMWREERLVSRSHGGPLLSTMLLRHYRDNYRLVNLAARIALFAAKPIRSRTSAAESKVVGGEETDAR